MSGKFSHHYVGSEPLAELAQQIPVGSGLAEQTAGRELRHDEQPATARIIELTTVEAIAGLISLATVSPRQEGDRI